MGMSEVTMAAKTAIVGLTETETASETTDIRIKTIIRAREPTREVIETNRVFCSKEAHHKDQVSL